MIRMGMQSASLAMMITLWSEASCPVLDRRHRGHKRHGTASALHHWDLALGPEAQFG